MESDGPRNPDLDAQLIHRCCLNPRPFLQDEFKFSGVCLEGAPRPLPNLSRIRRPGESQAPAPSYRAKADSAPKALIFGLKENSRADWEAVGTKRIRNHESRQTCGSGATGTVEQLPGDPRCLGERAEGMGEPARGAG